MLSIATRLIPLSLLSTVLWERNGLDTILYEYWLKELLESMIGWNGHRELTEIILKMALNMIGLNQSLQTTQIKFDPNDGIDLCD